MSCVMQDGLGLSRNSKPTLVQWLWNCSKPRNLAHTLDPNSGAFEDDGFPWVFPSGESVRMNVQKIQVSLHYNRQLLCLSCLGYLLNFFALFYTCWIASMNVLYTKTIQNYPKLLCVLWPALIPATDERNTSRPWIGAVETWNSWNCLRKHGETWGRIGLGICWGYVPKQAKKCKNVFWHFKLSECQLPARLCSGYFKASFEVQPPLHIHTESYLHTRNLHLSFMCLFLVSWWGHKYDFVSLPCCLVKTWIEQTSDFVYPKVQCKPLEPQNFPGMTLECKQDSGAKSDTCFKCLSVAIHFARHLQVTPVPGLARRTPIPSPSNAAPKHLRSNSGWVAIFFGTYR